MLGIYVLSSLLLGSALGRAISNFLIYSLGIRVLIQGQLIPGLSEELMLAKSFDLVDFALTIIFTLTNFLFLYYVVKTKNKLINLASLAFNFLLFLQVHFSTYNLFYLSIFLACFLILLLLATKTGLKLHDISKLNSKNLIFIANGVLAGFYLLLFINQFTTTILPLASLLLLPFLYLLFQLKLFSRQTHLLLVLSILAPNSLPWLLVVGVLTLALTLAVKAQRDYIYKYLYPAALITLAVYNPLYYTGRLDSVEEGFWLGWVSALRGGKALYREVAVYHPPLIIWVLNAFQKIAGYSITNTRLVLHLLQILGVIFYYFAVKKLIKSRLGIFIVMLIAISLTATTVRNNAEIRLGVGLLSLAFFSRPLLAGGLTAVSLFTSIEVGVASILAGLIGSTLGKKQHALRYLSGLLSVCLPILAVIALSGGVGDMIEQISFYANVFSSGYLNLPVERSVNSAFIHWHIVNQYIGAYPFLWELARAGLVGALIISLYKREKFAATLSIFGLLLFRFALGRSDFYHLLFPLLVSVPLIFLLSRNSILNILFQFFHLY